MRAARNNYSLASIWSLSRIILTATLTMAVAVTVTITMTMITTTSTTTMLLECQECLLLAVLRVAASCADV